MILQSSIDRQNLGGPQLLNLGARAPISQPLHRQRDCGGNGDTHPVLKKARGHCPRARLKEVMS